jgi:hypothetical protein
MGLQYVLPLLLGAGVLASTLAVPIQLLDSSNKNRYEVLTIYVCMVSVH